MANSFLDKTGLSYFWEKVKSHVNGKIDEVKQYVDTKVSESGGGSASLSTVTLTTSGWTGENTQTVSVHGILADETKQLIQPVAATTSKEQYELYGVSCTGQAADSLTFTCMALPESDLTVYVVVTELVAS